jgi:hypothetical protein
MEKLLTKRNTMILVGVLALWRLHLSAELQLHPDEDDYWLWSRYPDVGYFDHPPLGLLCFLPVVPWNGNHEWVSFPLQLNNGLGGEGYSLDKGAEYIGQLFVAGPVVWFLGHQLSAEIIYDTDTNLAAQTARISRPSQFNMWRSPKDAGRTDGLYVWSASDYIGPDGTFFSSASQSDSLHIYRDGVPTRTYHTMSGQKDVAPPFHAS